VTDPYALNRARWDERARFHLDTDFYGRYVARLRAGGDCLLPWDDAVLGDLEGLDVLHLQCHVGTDTLSLARRGARVTGVDFSAEAVAKARELAEELGIEARFVVGDVLKLDEVLGGDFDLVYASYGVLCWIGDLRRWSEVAAGFLRPGGRLVLIEDHPLSAAVADEQPDPSKLLLDWPYLGTGAPIFYEQPGSYADRDAKTEHDRAAEWSHGLGAIVQAVLDAGLALRRLTEHPESFWPRLESMVLGDDGLWRAPPELAGKYPYAFTLEAVRPGGER